MGCSLRLIGGGLAGKGGEWRGKKLLVDLDGTLIQSEEEPKGSDRYVLKGVRKNTLPALLELRDAGAMCILTSAAAGPYAESMAQEAGIRSFFYGVFSRDELGVRPVLGGKDWTYTPKDYRGVIAELGEEDPLSNCIIIGNDLGMDVPREPKGVVTAIAPIETDIGRILTALKAIMREGRGDFAAGFDRLWRSGWTQNDSRLVRDQNWKFNESGQGLARIVCFDTADEQLNAYRGDERPLKANGSGA